MTNKKICTGTELCHLHLALNGVVRQDLNSKSNDFEPEKVLKLLNLYFGMQKFHGIIYKRGRQNKVELSKIGEW